MLASELNKVKLKKVVTKDCSAAHQNAIANEKEMIRRMQESDVDFWYESIKEFTYETTFIPITPQEAEAMLAHYSARISNLEVPSSAQEIIDSVQKRVEIAMKDFGNDGVFVKLASRSPKDATNRIEPAKSILKSLLEEYKQSGKKITPDEIVNIVFQAHVSSFRLFTAEEVMMTILHSNRVMTDEIPLVLEHKNEWKEQIVLRRWCDVPVRYEFRGFIFDGKLTALCQYYNEVVCPELIEHKDKIEKLVLDFAPQIIDRIPITPKEYVIDFLVDLEKERVLVVEINPFGKPDGIGTGCVLFDPENPRDADILFGNAPFEFRIDTVPLCVGDYQSMIAAARKSTLNHWARSSLLCELPDITFDV